MVWQAHRRPRNPIATAAVGAGWDGMTAQRRAALQAMLSLWPRFNEEKACFRSIGKRLKLFKS